VSVQAVDRSRLVHHGLIPTPDSPGLDGVYWLRLYECDAGPVAVVTEVPGNHGPSVVNAIGEIVDYAGERFAMERARTTLFDVWPGGWTGTGAEVHRVRVGDGARWDKSSREEIEALVGAQLPELPGHDALLAEVLAAGGSATSEDSRPRYAAWPTADLPPGSPFRCPHHERIAVILREMDPSGQVNPDAEAAARLRFRDSLGPADLAACPYHRGDWRAVADASVAVIAGMESRPIEAYRQRAAEVGGLGS
jgi:hypothetical protein